MGRTMRRMSVLAGWLTAGCTSTLIDHDGLSLVSDGGLTCASSEHACGGSCVTEDLGSCGPTCQACPAVSNATSPGCVAHACDFVCDGGFLRCGGACCTAESVTAGGSHSCAITSGGRLKCWGANDQGQLGRGDGLFQDSVTPVDVAGLGSGVTEVAAGAQHTCAIHQGVLKCWGANGSGQLGTASTAAMSDTPGTVALTGASALGLGARHSCAVSAGSVFCWGANDLGQLAEPASTPGRSAPGAVAVLGGAGRLAAGRDHVCALLGGGVRCWGAGGRGQLGDGSTVAAARSPVTVQSLTDALALAAGDAHTCVAHGASSTSVACWGENGDQQLAVTGVTFAAAPVEATRLGGGLDPDGMAAGRAHSCAWRSNSQDAACFGANGAGQLGSPGPAETTADLRFSQNPRSLAAGGDHTCAVLADGSLYCWGANDRGQVGDGTRVDRTVPTLVSGH